MPLVRKEGKDTIIFATKEDHATPSKLSLPEPEPRPGLLLPSGEINWNCPCLGGMATGPCGVQFREAFSCFHYSTAEPKASDCYEAFKTMQGCMVKYPTLYGNKEKDLGNLDDDDDDDEQELDRLKSSKSETSSEVQEKNDQKDSTSEKKLERANQ
ncbi:hypothetical protein QAD02_005606 [Eretmocerus hayati]|uniref:Uncharacterized protein n=1 Tax=Eretmocerus hayati TaxID=131215 RepID=A0ACC2NVM8_9HYME|nr:hypothetical protein QAD02_005606 [Eretmocerus hayati]